MWLYLTLLVTGRDCCSAALVTFLARLAAPSTDSSASPLFQLLGLLLVLCPVWLLFLFALTSMTRGCVGCMLLCEVLHACWGSVHSGRLCQAVRLLAYGSSSTSSSVCVDQVDFGRIK